MSMQFKDISERDLEWARRVAEFLEKLGRSDPARWASVYEKTKIHYPFADLAYGAALADWDLNGRPADAWFSTAPGQVEDPYLLEYKDELAKEFGMPIMTSEEGMRHEKRVGKNVIRHDVQDWGPN